MCVCVCVSLRVWESACVNFIAYLTRTPSLSLSRTLLEFISIYIRFPWHLILYVSIDTHSPAFAMTIVFSPLIYFESSRTKDIWLQTIIFPSEWDSSWDLRKLSLRLSVYLLIHNSSHIPFYFPAKKKSRQSWLKFVTGHGSALRKKIGRKRSTFRQLPTNESPWCMSVKKIESTPCTATKRRFKGGQPFEKEINEILGSKREDRLSDPFFELIQNTTLVRFSYLLRLCNFCKVLRDRRKFPQKCQKIGGCWGRAVYVHNFWSLQHLAHPLRNDRV